MKMIVLSTAIAVAAVAAPGLAHAQQEGPYAGVGYTHYNAEDVEVGGLTGRLGYRFHPNFAVEGEATIGVTEDEVGPIDVELDHAYGVYGVGFLPVGSQTDIFGRVGYASVEASGSAGGVTVSEEQDGIGLGAGVQHMFNDRLGVRAEYTRLEGDDDGVNTFGVSGVMKF